METEIVAALVSGFVGLAGGLLSLVVSAKHTARLSTLEFTLRAESDRAKARQDYEYGALKRLYEEYEPIRFLLIEACERAITEIVGLTGGQTAEPGTTPGGNYRRISIIYSLLAPLALYGIVRRRLTLVDLQLDQSIRNEYALIRSAYLVFADDAEVARLAGITYTPYLDGWKEKRQLEPAQFRRQGFALGRLDNALEALIRKDGDHERVVTFGEFETLLKDVPVDDYSGPLGAAADLFDGFDVESRPVLCRIMLIQCLIYRALLLVVHNGADSSDLKRLLRVAADRESSVFDSTPTDASRSEFRKFALAYLEQRVRH